VILLLACEPTLKDAGYTDTGLSGTRDTACTTFTIYEDADGDGHGNPEVSQESCTLLAGWTTTSDDLDDDNGDCWDTCQDYECTELGDVTHGEGDTADPAQTSVWHVCHDETSWQEARVFCQTWLGGDLLAFNKEGERDSMLGFADQLRTAEKYWMGLSQPDTSPSVGFGWTWTSNQGVSQGYVDDLTIDEGGLWHAGQPNNGGFEENEGGEEEEDLGVLEWRQETWALGDQVTERKHAFFCEIYRT